MDGNRRHRLAILCGQADEEFQKLFIEGFEKQAFECGFDVCVFAMYMKFQEKKRREFGESKIYELLNCDLFDAFVVLGDTIQTPGVRDALEERLHEQANGPVFFIDAPSRYFPVINLKHYNAIVKLTEHLIFDHGFKDIAFISGKEWHPHSKERVDAFVNTMSHFGLPIGENRIFYGDFWYPSGADIANRFHNEHLPYPEAFICANDYMAIGLAGALTRNGVKVPEDVAVVGYDSVEEGRNSPSPITSIPLPVKQYGEYVASVAIDTLDGREIKEFEPDYELFIGGSCGCHCESCVPRLILRDGWKPGLLANPFYSYANRLAEDMSIEPNLTGMLNVIRSYMYQIGSFESFRICLNSDWAEDGPVNLTDDYSDMICEALTVKNSGKEGVIDLTRMFPLKDILPVLHEHDDKPRSFLFNPLHFDSYFFGYVVLSHGHDIVGMDVTYLYWLRTVMMGFEALRRRRLLMRAESNADLIRYIDPLTGLYNYDGLLRRMLNLIESDGGSAFITLIAVDISGVGVINEKFGRREGDKVIREFSKSLKACAGENSIYGRLGNDEFIVAFEWTNDGEVYVDKTIEDLRAILAKTNEGRENKLTFEYGYSSKKADGVEAIEDLINEAVSNKNGNKIKSRKMKLAEQFSDEDKEMAKRVGDLLDNNKFDYHFQPIVNAHNGSIFAYEALMRPISDPYIAPPVVIEFAERLGRLEEVEKLTFSNILKTIEENVDIFEGKKVFINSLPGIKVNSKDRPAIMEKIRKLQDNVVIELTEHSELDDQTLSDIKEDYRLGGVQMAVDDYGTGYSNVVNLLRYMPDYVKIDRMLMAGIEDNPQKQHFVSEIVNFAHENNFMALAEGVETSGELETCIKLGTDLIQGYYTGRPSKEIVRELPAIIREEIFRYSEQYFDDIMGTDI